MADLARQVRFLAVTGFVAVATLGRLPAASEDPLSPITYWQRDSCASARPAESPDQWLFDLCVIALRPHSGGLEVHLQWTGDWHGSTTVDPYTSSSRVYLTDETGRNLKLKQSGCFAKHGGPLLWQIPGWRLNNRLGVLLFPIAAPERRHFSFRDEEWGLIIEDLALDPAIATSLEISREVLEGFKSPDSIEILATSSGLGTSNLILIKVDRFDAGYRGTAEETRERHTPSESTRNNLSVEVPTEAFAEALETLIETPIHEGFYRPELGMDNSHHRSIHLETGAGSAIFRSKSLAPGFGQWSLSVQGKTYVVTSESVDAVHEELLSQMAALGFISPRPKVKYPLPSLCDLHN